MGAASPGTTRGRRIDDIAGLRRILATCKTIAVVGLSAVLSAAVVVCVGLAIAASNEESKELYGLDATTYLAYAGIEVIVIAGFIKALCKSCHVATS